MAAPSGGLMARRMIFVKQTGTLLTGKILPEFAFDPVAIVRQ
jgi:hypothetical protein